MKRSSFATLASVGFVLMLGVSGVHAASVPDTGSSADGALGAPMTNSALAHNRGGHALELSIANLDANLSKNKALDNVTGNNYVGQNAFSNASGFGTVVQNSGNNVIIQNSTIVNLKVQ